MRILIVTQWYPPEPQKLLSDLAISLLKLGYDVEVLTGFPNYPSGEIYPGYRIRMWQREVLDGVPVIRVPLYPDHSLSSVKRIINYCSFALAASLLGPWLASRPDAIFVLHPPLTSCVPAWLLSRMWRVPFVLNIQDMWPETLEATGMLPYPKLIKLVGIAANVVYSAASSIIVISNGFRRNLIDKGVASEKVSVVSNWVDTTFYRPVEPDAGIARKEQLQNKFVVMFAGVVGRAQGLETILQAAALVRDLPEILFSVVGDGVDLPALKKKAEELHSNNVVFLGRRPEAAMPSLFALADVLLLHLRDRPLFRITIPHKVFSYMASGKPVLAAVTGDAAEVVRSAGAGLVCSPDDAKGLAIAVRQFYFMSAKERQEMGARGRQAACTLYSRDHLVREVARVLEFSSATHLVAENSLSNSTRKG